MLYHVGQKFSDARYERGPRHPTMYGRLPLRLQLRQHHLMKWKGGSWEWSSCVASAPHSQSCPSSKNLWGRPWQGDRAVPYPRLRSSDRSWPSHRGRTCAVHSIGPLRARAADRSHSNVLRQARCPRRGPFDTWVRALGSHADEHARLRDAHGSLVDEEHVAAHGSVDIVGLAHILEV